MTRVIFHWKKLTTTVVGVETILKPQVSYKVFVRSRLALEACDGHHEVVHPALMVDVHQIPFSLADPVTQLLLPVFREAQNLEGQTR